MQKKINIAMITAILLLSFATISASSAAVYNITDTSYSNYFNASGYINDTSIVSGDVLDCSGAINNKNMYIDRALNITSSDLTVQILNGTITILPAGSGTNITNLVINNSNQNGIVIDGADGNSITNNQITVHQDTASYGIQLIDADNNHITGNTINTTGDTVIYGVYLDGSSSNELGSNTINTTGRAGDVDWSDYMDGAIYSTLGVFISDGSSSNTLTNNIITTVYNATSGSGYDTVAGVQIRKDCDGNSLSGNTINTTGYSYAYGLEVVGGDETESTDNVVSNNNINTVGESIFANGVKVGAYTENTLVSGNDVTATAPDFAYGIYLENFTGLLRNVTITGNEVNATANINYVIELYAASGTNLTNGNKITNNVLMGVGNYSLGIATTGSRYNTINGNTISITGDNTATHITNADSIPESNAGIKLYTSSRYNVVNSNIISGTIVTGSTSSNGIHLYRSTYNTLQDNTINNSFTNGLFLENASNYNTLTSNDVSIDNVDEDDNSYGIHLSASNNNTITENNITTIGDGTGSAGNGKFTYGVYLEGSVDNALGTNVIHTTGAAADVDWSTGNYPTIGVYLSADSNSNDLTSNTITTDYNTISAGGYDTILGVRINKSDANNLTANNIINTTGDSYAYGLEIVGASDNTSTGNIVSNNTISTVGNTSYANGAKVGIYTADTAVSGNTVSATAPDFAYALYLEDYMGGSLTNVTLNGNNATATANASYVLELYGASGNSITNNVLNGTGHEESYGIHLVESRSNNFTGNTVNTVGDTVTTITYGVYLEGSSENTLNRNTIHTTGAAADVDWSDWMNGGKYPTIGVFLFEGSNSNELTSNTITTDYNPALLSGTGWDTLLGVRIHKDSSENSIINNNILNTTGYSYAYGIEILGNNGNISTANNLSNNTINTVGNSVYANGVKVSAYTVDTVVSGNTVTATAPTFTYGIYLENYGGLVNANVNNNNVTTTSDVNYVVELFDVDGCTITNNILTGTGNYSMGIGTYGSASNIITYNTITTIGDNNAPHPPSNADAIPESNEGIKLHFNSDSNTVEYNIINSSDVYAVNSDHEQSDSNIIRYNYLFSDNGNKLGNDAVTSGGNDTVTDNGTSTDLMVNNLVLPENPVVGQSYQVPVNVTNNGVSNAGAFVLKLYDTNVQVAKINLTGLTSGASSVFNFNWTPSSAGVHVLAIIADTDNQIIETDENNNLASAEVTVNSSTQPDLLVSNIQLPVSPVVGTTYPVIVTVSNAGAVDAGAFVVKLYDNNTQFANISLAGLTAGTNTDVTFNWLTYTTGTHNLSIIADANQQINEYNEYNNQISQQTSVNQSTQPDLTITNLQQTANPVVATTSQITATITNLGTVDSDAFVVKLYDNNTQIAKINLTGLAAGTSTDITFNWLTYTTGTHNLSVIADANGQISEYNEANNQISQQVSVGASTQPDLTVTDLQLPSNPVAGTNYQITATVTNLGTVDAAAFAVKLYDNNNQVMKINLTGLTAGISTQVTFNWTPTTGTHNLAIKADANQQIIEYNENNNIITQAINVTS